MDLRERGAATRRHPWEMARARFVLETLAGSGALPPSPRVLDVGAGDAFVAGLLAGRLAGARVVAWDAHFTDRDLESLAGLGFQVVREQPKGPFDAVLLLDVLEHVEDDHGFLARIVAESAPGAVFLVTVPAWPQLFSAHDLALGHFRRYTPASCRKLLTKAGLTVTRSGGLFHALLLPRWAASLAERELRPRASAPESGAAWNRIPTGVGGWSHGRLISKLVDGALALDQRLSKAAARIGFELPGLSFWALCRKAAP
jgi:SAM-dependent methyltransferase